ncbi:MAG: hypothetical protein GXP31_07120 [Kiritimatiellaeota bacterium]|nr:hypothetical protein [Kiritimatiellota bacterium]
MKTMRTLLERVRGRIHCAVHNAGRRSRFGLYAFAACGFSVAATLAADVNPVSNGGFEDVGPDGRPRDWEYVGREARLVQDAHSGKRAILLRRTPEIAAQKGLETGLNRAWRPHSGERGRMLTERKGGIRFFYKVVRADADAQLRFFVIPMNAGPMENTGSPRAVFEVPKTYAGDGKWHLGIVGYDFTKGTACRWVQVSPRIMGQGTAEWLLDDIQWVPNAGPVPSIRDLRVYETPGAEGRSCTLRLVVRNAGDRPLKTRAVLSLSNDLRVRESSTRTVGPLAAQGTTAIEWTVLGARSPRSRAAVRLTAGEIEATRSVRFAPKIVESWIETGRFVLWPGARTQATLVLRNTGTCTADGITARIAVGAGLRVLGPAAVSGRSAVPGKLTRIGFQIEATAQTPVTEVRCTWQSVAGECGECRAELVVGAPAPAAPQDAPKDALRLTGRTAEIIFPRNGFGYGIGWVYARPSGEPIGVIPRLGRIVSGPADTAAVPLFADSAKRGPPGPCLGGKTDGSNRGGSSLTFLVKNGALAKCGLPEGVSIRFAVPGSGASGAAARLITVTVRARVTRPGAVRALDGPFLCPGEGASSSKRTEALFPGLEWLQGDEYSSWDTDIAFDHPDRLRSAPHPHKITIPLMVVRRNRVATGLFWHSRATWNDGVQPRDFAPDESAVDRPCAVFAAPDRFAGHASSTLGLFLPTIPHWIQPNERAAARAWPTQGAAPLRIRLVYGFYVNPASDSVLDAVLDWARVFGFPAPRRSPRARGPAPAPGSVDVYRGPGLPDWARAADFSEHWSPPAPGQWVDEVEWSMNAYLKSLWDPEQHGWWNYWGGPGLTHKTGAYPAFLLDCVIGERLTDDPELGKRLKALLDDVRGRAPESVPGGDDMGFRFGDPTAALAASAVQAGDIMRAQPAEGGWRFRPRIGKGGVFRGRDYRLLGRDGEEGNGLTARRAYNMLFVSRMTGDETLLSAGLKALRSMEKFRIPRAAQVWEVPVHTPDILAAADACEAYLEAYRITGDKQWLDRAVYWETAGLPFLYLWDVDAFPFLRYASIPVFGATWKRGSWFGRPVQWNGLRWAFAAQKLAEVDSSLPWRMLAAGVTISAMYQQGSDPESKSFALWPDSISAEDARKSAWVFPPVHILENVYKLMGYEPRPTTVAVPAGAGKIRIDACGRIGAPQYAGGVLRFALSAPPPLPTQVLVIGISSPTEVLVDGKALPRADTAERRVRTAAWWTYDRDARLLRVRPNVTGKHTIALRSVRWRAGRVLPQVQTRLDFDFDSGRQGWRPAHDIAAADAADGVLDITVNGPDPYLVRPMCRIDGNMIARIHVRMAVDGGNRAQFYWTTAKAPAMSEARAAWVAVNADGRMHDYSFDVGAHPLWRGQIITAVRLDPTNGVKQARARIDFVRGDP